MTLGFGGVVGLTLLMAVRPVSTRAVDPRRPPEPAAVPHPQTSESSPAPSPADGKPIPQPRIEPEERSQPLAVAVGLGPAAPGSKQEVQWLDRLERSVGRSTHPPTVVRRLRAGAGDAKRICREGRDDLVMLIGYLPDRDDPVVLARDCRLDRALGVRSLAAIDEPGLVAALQREHRQALADGAQPRKPWLPLGRRARTALIATGVIVFVGAAVGLLLASVLREERVVLTVSP